MNNVFKALALTALLSACASQQVDSSQARAVPPSSILSAQLLSPEPGTGKLIVKRDSGFGGAGCSIRISVDGEPVVDLNTSEKFEFYLPVGDHVLEVKWNGICGGGTSGVEVVIAENRTKVYRILIGHGGDIHIQPSAF